MLLCFSLTITIKKDISTHWTILSNNHLSIALCKSQTHSLCNVCKNKGQVTPNKNDHIPKETHGTTYEFNSAAECSMKEFKLAVEFD